MLRRGFVGNTPSQRSDKRKQSVELPRRQSGDILLLEYLGSVAAGLHQYNINQLIELTRRRFGHRKASVMVPMLEAARSALENAPNETLPDAPPQGGEQ
jgi:hypothetical protein